MNMQFNIFCDVAAKKCTDVSDESPISILKSEYEEAVSSEKVRISERALLRKTRQGSGCA